MKKLVALFLALVMILSLAACTGPVTDPTNAPTTGNPDPTDPTPAPTQPVDITTYSQAPYIKDVLGITSDVTDRLPVAEDIFVENAGYLEVGVYGGTLKRNAGTGWYTGKPIEEGLFRFDSTGAVAPNVAKGYAVNEDSTVYTIYLREGMKWSDGQPFTAEDCVWFYNIVCLNKLDSKGVRNCHKDANGNPAVVEKVDDYTFTVTFGTPKYDFLQALTIDLKWHWAPKHVFETFCNLVIEGKTEEALAESERLTGKKFKDAGDAGKQMMYYFWNVPNVPTLNPYVLTTEAGKNNVGEDALVEFIRNPYYWKTDVKGNQLPYIDKIAYIKMSDDSQNLLSLLDGTIDLIQAVNMADIPTIKKDATVGINIFNWAGDSWGDTGSQLHFNLAVADGKLNALFNNKAFREAMSICVDRAEFAGIYSEGWLEGGQAAPQKGQGGYDEEWAKQWTEYNVAKAKTLLESCGLVMGGDGFYDFADGTDFVLNIRSVAESGAGETYKVLEKYYTEVGIKTTFKEDAREIINSDMASGVIECMLSPVTGLGGVSIGLKANAFVPGYATNVVWYGTMTKETATGDLLKLIELKEQLDVTADLAERERICNEMLKLHKDNQWVIAYVEASSVYHAVNERIHNFLESAVWADEYREMGLAHIQCWFIPADQQ
jgi:peptide/nickel transport system substrate-binding protein